MYVSMTPGATAFTRMPRAFHFLMAKDVETRHGLCATRSPEISRTSPGPLRASGSPIGRPGCCSDAYVCWRAPGGVINQQMPHTSSTYSNEDDPGFV
jgi:hypothetical protein